MYSYKNIMYKYGSWDVFEQSFISPARDPLPLFLNQDKFHIFTLTNHAGPKSDGPGFSECFFTDYASIIPTLNINWLNVTLSEKYKTMPDFFDSTVGKRNQIGPPVRYTNPKQLLKWLKWRQEYIDKYNPYNINLDAFLEGPDSFVAEYEKVSLHLNLTPHIDDALELYQDWYKARRFTDYLATLK